MWLVVGQDLDAEGPWIAAGLRERADRPVAWVTASQLVHDCRWELRVGAGGASSRLELGDGTVLDLDTVDAVVNRLLWLGADGYAGASARDRDYATSELFALGLGWLESLGGRVISRPAGNGLGGPWRSPAEWRSLARAVGLPVVPYDSDDVDPHVPVAAAEPTDHVVLVLDGEVVEAGASSSRPSGPSGPFCPSRLTPAVRESLAALQRAAGLDLFEVRLGLGAGSGDRLALRSASYLVAMSRFGDVGLDALHKALVARECVRGGVRR